MESSRSELNEFLPPDIIQEQYINHRQHAKKLQHKNAGRCTHSEKHHHENKPADQHIIVNGANHIEAGNLLPVPQFNGLRNVKTICHYNA